MDALQIREWSYSEWQAHEAQWTALLRETDQDPLFLSSEWMSLWWEVFGGGPTQSLCVLAAYCGNALIGIAPLYRLKVRRRGLPARSIQFIGIAWRDSGTLISEYLDIIAPPRQREAVRAAFMLHLSKDRSWSEFIANYSPATAAQWRTAIAAAASDDAVYCRVIERSTSHQADLSRGFDAYLARLGQNTRRSLWHLRRRIQGTDSRLEHVTAEHIQDAFADLNRLHFIRWGHAAFAQQRLRFHTELARRLAQRGELVMSRLWANGEAISVLYDIRKGTRQYNIKMAFDPRIERSFSVGLIHLGHAMEAAAAAGVATYDLLAGAGLKTDFKSHLSQLTRELFTVQLIKGRLLPHAYRWYDARRKKPVAEVEAV